MRKIKLITIFCIFLVSIMPVLAIDNFVLKMEDGAIQVFSQEKDELTLIDDINPELKATIKEMQQAGFHDGDLIDLSPDGKTVRQIKVGKKEARDISKLFGSESKEQKWISITNAVVEKSDGGNFLIKTSEESIVGIKGVPIKASGEFTFSMEKDSNGKNMLDPESADFTVGSEGTWIRLGSETVFIPEGTKVKWDREKGYDILEGSGKEFYLMDYSSNKKYQFSLMDRDILQEKEDGLTIKGFNEGNREISFDGKPIGDLITGTATFGPREIRLERGAIFQDYIKKIEVTALGEALSITDNCLDQSPCVGQTEDKLEIITKKKSAVLLKPLPGNPIFDIDKRDIASIEVRNGDRLEAESRRSDDLIPLITHTQGPEGLTRITSGKNKFIFEDGKIYEDSRKPTKISDLKTWYPEELLKESFAFELKSKNLNNPEFGSRRLRVGSAGAYVIVSEEDSKEIVTRDSIGFPVSISRKDNQFQTIEDLESKWKNKIEFQASIEEFKEFIKKEYGKDAFDNIPKKISEQRYITPYMAQLTNTYLQDLEKSDPDKFSNIGRIIMLPNWPNAAVLFLPEEGTFLFGGLALDPYFSKIMLKGRIESPFDVLFHENIHLLEQFTERMEIKEGDSGEAIGPEYLEESYRELRDKMVYNQLELINKDPEIKRLLIRMDKDMVKLKEQFEKALEDVPPTSIKEEGVQDTLNKVYKMFETTEKIKQGKSVSGGDIEAISIGFETLKTSFELEEEEPRSFGEMKKIIKDKYGISSLYAVVRKHGEFLENMPVFLEKDIQARINAVQSPNINARRFNEMRTQLAFDTGMISARECGLMMGRGCKCCQLYKQYKICRKLCKEQKDLLPPVM